MLTSRAIRRRQQPDRHRPAGHQLGGAATEQRRHLSPCRHRRDQLHVRGRLAGLLRHLARGRRHARWRDAARGAQGPGIRRRHPAGRSPVQRHSHPGLGGSVRGGRAARGDRSRLDRLTPGVGPHPRFGVRCHVVLPGHLDRHRAQRPGRRERRLRRGLPGTAACATATSTASTSPICSGWARASATSCGPLVRYTIDDREGERSAATATGCS